MELLLLVPALVVLWRVVELFRQSRRYPPGPKQHWLLGNLLDMPALEPWVRFSEWAHAYGDVTYLNVLGRPIIILNTLSACAELLERRGAQWSGRPVGYMHELMGMGNFMIMQQETASWRLQRRLIHRFFGPRDVGRHTAVQAQHAALFVQKMRENSVDWRAQLRVTVSKSVFAVMYGLPSETYFKEFIRTGDTILRELFAAIVPGNYLVDVVPALRFIPPWMPGAGFKRHARIVAPIVDHYVSWYYDEAKNAVERGDALPSFVPDSCLQEQSEAKIEATDKFIRWTASSLYLAAVDTTDQTMAKFIEAMSMYPCIQQKAQDELDHVLSRDVLPTLADRDRLPYLGAVIKETMRWRLLESIAVGLAHRTTEEQEYQGCYVPENATAFYNLWHISRCALDGTPLEDADDFKPQRFLPLANDKLPNPSEYIFGFGRRICPGRHMAENAIFIMAAYILTVFRIDKPEKKQEEGPANDETRSALRFSPRSAGSMELVSSMASFNSSGVKGEWDM